jgi:hypothetical protein
MHLLLAPVLLTGLALKIYNNSKKDILDRKLSFHSKYNNIKYLNIDEVGNDLHVAKYQQKRAVDF